LGAEVVAKIMKTNINILATLIIIAIVTPLAGCSSSITREEAEKEIVVFMLDSIIPKPDGETSNYVQISGEPWLNAPPSAILIVYSPPNENKNKDSWDQLKTDEPIKAWWYFDNKLVEATDKPTAIQKYVEYYEYNSYDWLSYEFGILSISANNKKATVYYGLSSCPECAGGSILTIERNDSGKWEITDSELLWLS